MLIAMAVYDTVENNRTWMTKATMESLAYSVDWRYHRMFIVDNGSCQETLDWYIRCMSDCLFPFRMIYNNENLGTARAVNRGWRHREPGEHCVKMDNDVIIHQPDWADWIEDVFDRDPSIGICGLKRKDLAESPHVQGDFHSEIRMLPHELGQRWLIVEDVAGVMGTCQAYSSALLDRIGYLVQPGLYGFDDSLSTIRARIAGFRSAFLHGFEIDHIDPGGDAFCEWKVSEAIRLGPTFNAESRLYTSGQKDIYYDGGFDE